MISHTVLALARTSRDAQAAQSGAWGLQFVTASWNISRASASLPARHCSSASACMRIAPRRQAKEYAVCFSCGILVAPLVEGSGHPTSGHTNGGKTLDLSN